LFLLRSFKQHDLGSEISAGSKIPVWRA